MSNATEKFWLRLVAGVGCVLCRALGQGFVPNQIHHVREDQGMGERASHFLIAALCPDCHLGPHGIHGDRSRLRLAKLEELDLVALTIAAVVERLRFQKRLIHGP